MLRSVSAAAGGPLDSRHGDLRGPCQAYLGRVFADLAEVAVVEVLESTSEMYERFDSPPHTLVAPQLPLPYLWAWL